MVLIDSGVLFPSKNVLTSSAKVCLWLGLSKSLLWHSLTSTKAIRLITLSNVVILSCCITTFLLFYLWGAILLFLLLQWLPLIYHLLSSWPPWDTEEKILFPHASFNPSQGTHIPLVCRLLHRFCYLLSIVLSRDAYSLLPDWCSDCFCRLRLFFGIAPIPLRKFQPLKNDLPWWKNYRYVFWCFPVIRPWWIKPNRF